MISKICTGCNVSKTLDQFSKDKNKPDGHHSHCKACAKAYQAVYRANNRDRIRTSVAAYYTKNRDQLNAQRTAAYNADAELREQRAIYSQSPKGKFATYKSNAKTRGISFDLSMDQFMSFWQADCSYCGDPISTIGIDRIDSNLSYTVGNCVPCCTRCNVIKMDYDIDETDAHMLKMLRHRGII